MHAAGSNVNRAGANFYRYGMITVNVTLSSHPDYSLPVHLSLCLYLRLSLSLSASISLCLSLSVCLSLSLFVSLSLCFSLPLFLSLYLTLWLSLSLSLFVSVSLCLSMYISLSLSLYFALSLSLSLYLAIPLSLWYVHNGDYLDNAVDLYTDVQCRIPEYRFTNLSTGQHPVGSPRVYGHDIVFGTRNGILNQVGHEQASSIFTIQIARRRFETAFKNCIMLITL